MKVSERKRKGAFLHNFICSDSILHRKRLLKEEIVSTEINISNKENLKQLSQRTGDIMLESFLPLNFIFFISELYFLLHVFLAFC